MKLRCEVVQDLLPLYLDKTCSGESAQAVGEHLDECPACRLELEKLHREPEPCSGRAGDGEGIRECRRGKGTVSLQAVRAAAGIIVIILIWLGYLWQEGLAEQGNYRYFSYSFHEAYGVVLMATVSATWLWLAVVLWRSCRRRTWKRNWALLLVLGALIWGQITYFYHAQVTNYSGVAQVVRIAADGYQVDIQAGEERKTLETVPLISNLLEMDGTLYLVNYKESRAHPGQYWLSYVWDIVEPGNKM